MSRSSHPHQVLLSSIYKSFSSLYGPSHIRAGVSTRREQWSLCMGLVLGVGLATIFNAFLLHTAESRRPDPHASSSLTSSFLPRAIRSFFSLPFPSSTRSTVPTTGVSGKRPKILLFGDSLTQRGFEGPGQGWAAGLAHAYGRRADIVNRGFSGYTTKWCALMAPMLFPAGDPAWEVPALAIVFLGANDAALPSREQHVPVHEYEQHLRRIVSHLQGRRREDGSATRVLLLTPPPVDEARWEAHCRSRGRPLDRKNEVTRLYARASKGVAREMQVPVVDLWRRLGGRNPEAVAPNLGDGLHLSAQGSILVYEAVLTAIEENYPDLAPSQLPMQAPEHFELTSQTESIEVK